MRCPGCGSSAVLRDELRGELICTRCGLVLVEKLPELTPEQKQKPGEEIARGDMTTGIDLTRHDLGLGSTFKLRGDLPPSLRARLRRMQLWQRRFKAGTSGEKSLREALIELDKLCEDLSLPKGLRTEASSLYRKAKVAKLTVGRGTWQVLAALTFITCRMRNVPRTEAEVAHALATRADLEEQVAVRKMRQLVKVFAKKMELKVPHISAEDYIIRFAPQLGLSRRTTARANELHRGLPKKLRQGKPALLLAAAVIYLAAKTTGKKITMGKIVGEMRVGNSSLCRTVAQIRELTTAREG